MSSIYKDGATNATLVKQPEPAVQRHTRAMYEAMLEESFVNDAGDVRIYEGYITKTYNRTRASNVYQHHVLSILKDYNCIAVERVGVRNTTSRVIMLNHPDDAGIPPEAWMRHRKDSAPDDLTTPDDFARLAESVKNLAAQIGSVSLGDLAKGIAAELADIKGRLSKLESKIGEGKDAKS